MQASHVPGARPGGVPGAGNHIPDAHQVPVPGAQPGVPPLGEQPPPDKNRASVEIPPGMSISLDKAASSIKSVAKNIGKKSLVAVGAILAGAAKIGAIAGSLICTSGVGLAYMAMQPLGMLGLDIHEIFDDKTDPVTKKEIPGLFTKASNLGAYIGGAALSKAGGSILNYALDAQGHVKIQQDWDKKAANIGKWAGALVGGTAGSFVSVPFYIVLGFYQAFTTYGIYQAPPKPDDKKKDGASIELDNKQQPKPGFGIGNADVRLDGQI